MTTAKQIVEAARTKIRAHCLGRPMCAVCEATMNETFDAIAALPEPEPCEHGKAASKALREVEAMRPGSTWSEERAHLTHGLVLTQNTPCALPSCGLTEDEVCAVVRAALDVRDGCASLLQNFNHAVKVCDALRATFAARAHTHAAVPVSTLEKMASYAKRWGHLNSDEHPRDLFAEAAACLPQKGGAE